MTDLQPDYFERPLADVDPEVAEALGRELERQQGTLEMIASATSGSTSASGRSKKSAGSSVMIRGP